jgi:hypothetical protein
VEGQNQTELTITLRHPGFEPVTRVLRDPPADPAPDGGPAEHPHPTAALGALAASTNPFAPVPPGTMATMIYGGPQTATVTGTWRGNRVDTTFCRTDGAQIQRWDRVAALLDVADMADEDR